MPPLTTLLRGLGAAGAAANARDELDRAHRDQIQAAIVVRRVNRSCAATCRSVGPSVVQRFAHPANQPSGARREAPVRAA